jgi:hypothetical protein
MLRYRNIRFLTTEYFEVAKFATLTLLSLLFSCKFVFPIAGVKILTVPSFKLKYHFPMVLRKRKESCSSFLIETKSLIHHFYPRCEFRTIISPQRRFNTIYDIALLTKSPILTDGMIFWCASIQSLTDNFLSHRKTYKPVRLFHCQLVPSNLILILYHHKI